MSIFSMWLSINLSVIFGQPFWTVLVVGFLAGGNDRIVPMSRLLGAIARGDANQFSFSKSS
jgi:hypothetical protein